VQRLRAPAEHAPGASCRSRQQLRAPLSPRRAAAPQGLRLHDNPALLEACRGAAHVYPIFILDPFFLQSGQYK
jgi:hypothetical protein